SARVSDGPARASGHGAARAEDDAPGDAQAFSAGVSLRRNALERDLRATEKRLRDLDARLAALVRARKRNGVAAGAGTNLDLRSACRVPPVSGELPPTASRLQVVVINGGATKAQNYQSHFLHVRRLLELLVREGVTPARTTIFDADGMDRAPDMAVRELQPEA